MSGSIRKESVFQFVNNLVVDLVTPVNISYLWNWGSLLGFFLVGQIITGIFLAMFYCPHETLGFRLVAELGLNINSGFFSATYMLMGLLFFFYVCIFILQRGCITGVI